MLVVIAQRRQRDLRFARLAVAQNDQSGGRDAFRQNLVTQNRGGKRLQPRMQRGEDGFAEVDISYPLCRCPACSLPQRYQRLLIAKKSSKALREPFRLKRPISTPYPFSTVSCVAEVNAAQNTFA